MKRIVPSVAIVFAATLAAVPAFAHGTHGNESDGAAAFPMSAAAFQQRIDARIARGKARVEKKIADGKVEGAQAREMRARFDARTQNIQAAAAEAEKDGVVTQEEARTVRAAGGGGCHHAKA